MYIACEPPLGTPDGMYTATFTLTSNDPDESPLTWPVWCLIDSTPPSLEFIQSPDGRNGWFVTQPAPLQIRGVDPESGNRVKHIFCTDNGAPTLDWPNGSFAFFSFQPEGLHALSCQGTDVANNTSAPGAYTTAVKVDATQPETTKGDVGPPALSDQPVSSFSFTGSDATSGVQEFECRLDSEPYGLCTSPASRIVRNGTHTFDVRARDAAGNYDPTPEQWTWDVDAPLPDLSITSGPTGKTKDKTPSFGFSSTVTTATFSCSLDDASPVSCASPFTSKKLKKGKHTFAVFATDAAGNQSATTTRSFKVKKKKKRHH
jgi:hypothetical protein